VKPVPHTWSSKLLDVDDVLELDVDDELELVLLDELDVELELDELDDEEDKDEMLDGELAEDSDWELVEELAPQNSATCSLPT